MDDALVRQIRDGVFNYINHYRVLLDEKFSLTWGTSSLTDEEFGRWFLMKAAENPNWLFALPYVRGGNRELGRYRRLITEEAKGYDTNN